MSYFVTNPNLRRWLDKAQLALVSKNKVRKDLWTDFSDIITFDEDEKYVTISSSEFLTIQSFLQIEGKSDSITNDSFLSWNTTLNELRKKLVRDTKSRAPTPEIHHDVEHAD